MFTLRNKKYYLELSSIHPQGLSGLYYLLPMGEGILLLIKQRIFFREKGGRGRGNSVLNFQEIPISAVKQETISIRLRQSSR